MQRHRAEPGDRRYVDDAAASTCNHRQAKGDAGEIGSPEIDAQDFVVHLQGQRLRRQRDLHDAGAVHEGPYGAVIALDARRCRPKGNIVPHIRLDGDASDLIRDFLRRREIAIQHHDARAPLRQFFATGVADFHWRRR